MRLVPKLKVNNEHRSLKKKSQFFITIDLERITLLGLNPILLIQQQYCCCWFFDAVSL